MNEDGRVNLDVPSDDHAALLEAYHMAEVAETTAYFQWRLAQSVAVEAEQRHVEARRIARDLWVAIHQARSDD